MPPLSRRALSHLLLTSTALIGLGAPGRAQTLPTGYSTASGRVGFQRSGGALTINQTSQNAVVNYNSFSIGQGNSVTINQPTSRSSILNRVTGSTPSSIAGTLSANGQVYLVNPNGIAITDTGSVKVGGGFVASTLGITDEAFGRRRKRFTGDGASAAVSNAGTITIGRGGYAALIGGQVSNSGMIAVPMGQAALGSGETATLDLSGDGFLQVAVPTSAGGKAALVQNAGTISAEGGTVVLDAATARAAARNAVNIAGTIDAHSVAGRSGNILIGGGDGGRVAVSGRLDASSVRGTGGAVTLTGSRISLKHATIDATGATGGGAVRIGGDLHGAGTLQHAARVTVDAATTIKADATLKGNGGSVVVWSDDKTSFQGTISAVGGPDGGDGGNAEVSSHGVLDYAGTTILTAAAGATGTLLLDPYDITISDAADSGTPLGSGTVTATSNINITTLATALNTANVSLSTGAAGSAGSDAGNITLSSTSAATLSWASSATLTLTAAGNITLGAPISAAAGGLTLNAGGTIGATSGISLARFTLASGSFSQIAATLPAFSAGDFEIAGGTFVRATRGDGSTGNPYTLTDIYGVQGIATLPSNNFALAADIDATQTATWNAGAGFLPIGQGTATFSGTFNGAGHTIANLTINQPNGSYVGLFGISNGVIENVGVIGGTVRGLSYVGDLVGYSYGGSISQAYATGAVTTGDEASYVGGLVGENRGSISQAYATGAVTTGSSVNFVGGLVGYNTNTINQAYATGAVTTGSSPSYVGGLVGYSYGAISQTYATGAVTTGSSPLYVGGLAGGLNGTLSNSFYDSYTTGQSQGTSTSLDGSGTVTAVTSDPTQSGAANYAYKQSAYTGFTFVTSPSGAATTPGFYMVNGGTRPFLSSEYSTTITNSHQLELVNLDPTGTYTLANNIDLGPDLAAVGAKYPGMFGAAGFAPIGNATTPFSGSFNGAGHTIANLTINQPGATDVGLFGSSSGLIDNIGVIGGTVNGHGLVGDLVGYNTGTISQAYATGAVTAGDGSYDVGGLVGNSPSGSISQVYATGAVTTGSNAFYVGGLVGFAYGASISQAYAAGAVTTGSGAFVVGGLVGKSGASISQAYATGAVTTGSNSDEVGGLVGYNFGSISQAYATGAVTAAGTQYVGGLLGLNTGTIANSFYDSYTTGQSQGVSGTADVPGSVTAVTSDPAQSGAANYAYEQSAYAGLNFVTNPSSAATAPGFYMVDGGTRPFLSSEYSTTINNSHQLQLIWLDPTATYTLANTIDLGPDLAAVGGKYPGMFSAAGFVPIGNDSTYFSGTFNGAGHTIADLMINQPYATDVGLFGFSDSVIENIGLVGGTVNGQYRVGELLGYNSGGTVSQAYATGAVTTGNSPYNVGGLVGLNTGTISQAYASDAVTTGNNPTNVGGLVGGNYGNIGPAYATGAVTTGINSSQVGGLVGYNPGSISQAYATGAVTTGSGASFVGGLVGSGTGSVTSAFWDEQSTGQATSAAGTGIANTAAAQDLSSYATTYAGFDFANTWSPPNQVGQNNNSGTAYYPQLYALSHIVAVNPTSSRQYGASSASAPILYDGVQPGDYVTTLATPGNAGATSAAPVGVSSGPPAAGGVTTSDGLPVTASGATYRSVYLPGTLTVTPAPLTITADSQSKVYGAALPTLTASYTGFVNGDTAASLSAPPTLATAATAASHVADGPFAITPSGAVDGNYSINYVPGSLSVTPAPLTISADSQTKVYGAALPTLTASYTGLVNGDTAASLDTAPTLTTTATAASHVAGSPFAITASGAVDSDYSISYVPGSLGVTPAPLTISADNQTKVYGAALPTLTASFTGFVNGDTAASLSTTPTLATTATAASHVAGSPFAITPSGAVDSDYSISYVPGSLGVTTAPLTISADSQTKVYGAALPTLTASYTGLVNGDTAASLNTPPTLATTATAASHVAAGPFAITPSGAVDSDYSISYVPGSLGVTMAPLTITADDQSKVYGAALPTLTASYTGLVNGDTATSLSMAPTLTTTATAASHVAGSPFAITPSGAADGDYAISYVAGSLNVTAAPLTISADNQTKVYGAAMPTLTTSYTGFVNGDTTASLSTLPTLATTATAASHVAGSPFAITPSGAVDSDYAISYVPGSLGITPAPLTITAYNQTKVYGAALPALTAIVTGFVNGDTAASLNTLPTLTTTATAASHVAAGPFAITPSGAVDSDYAISYVPGSLGITPAPLTITADNQSKVYGAALPTLTASYTGFVNGDTAASLDTAPTLTTTATAASHVAGSPFAITPSGAVDSDYAISYVPGSLGITTAPLTITADNQSKVYGAALPTLTASYAGFVNGDTAASLSTLPTLATTATAASHVAGSPYAITSSGAVDSDYAISYVPGSLGVTPAPLTITAYDQTKVYGAALPALTAIVTGFVNGDTAASLNTLPTLTTTATAASHVAGSPFAITASGAVDSDYAISYVAGSLSVTAAPLTITADNQIKVYGAALPTLTASYTGLVNGDTAASLSTTPTLTTTATAASHVAGSPFAITASGAVDSDYAISYVAGSLGITAAPLTITANDQSKLYGAALPTLTASYTGFVNGDTAASLDTAPTLTTTATAASHVAGSPFAITPSGAVDSDYAISYVPGSLGITTAPLTITADNQSKVYGAALPTLTASYAGFVNGDTAASLSTLPTLATTATAASHVAGSPYAITSSGAVDSDYAISYVPGRLGVTPAPLTITAYDQTKVYGAALPALTAIVTGFVNGDTAASLNTLPTLTTTATAASHVAGSPFAITASGAVDSDYAISYVAGSLSVTAAPLTITADNQIKVYGAALPTLTASYTGLVNGDTAASLDTAPTLTTTATAASHVAGSPFAITASGAVDSDYAISYVPGSLGITAAPLTITANDQSKLYGAALPTLTASYTGFVNGDTAASLSTPPTLATTATAASHVAGSPFAITPSGAVDSDYAISYVPGSLGITTAPLTITADNQSKVYGAALPTLTAIVTGFVNGDTAASLNTLPTLTTTATAASHVAGSPFAITASGAVDSDYAISYVAGSLSVTAAPLTITADNQIKVYGAALPTLTASYTGLVNGDTAASLDTAPTLTTTATAASHVAGSPFAITASGAVDSDYAISYVPGSLGITAAPLTITANDQSKLYGAALPTLTASYTGFVNGDTAASLSTPPTLATTATAASHVAGSPFAITPSGAVDSDYAISYVPGSLNVTAVPLTIAADNQSKLYGAALPTLTASYTGFVNGDTAASLDTAPTLTTTATAAFHVAAGPFAITASGAADSDYAISYVAGSLNVTAATLNVTANGGTSIYGNPSAHPGLSATGLQNGDGVGVLTGLSNAFGITSQTNVGSYAVSIQGTLTNTDYVVGTGQSGTFSVTPRSLTVAADNRTRLFDTVNPPLTYTIGGLGLTNGDALTGTLVTTAAQSSPIGIYPITQGTLTASSNYAVTFRPGTLAIQPSLDLPSSGLASTVDSGVFALFGRSVTGLPVLIATAPDQGGLAPDLAKALNDPRFNEIVLCNNLVCTVVSAQPPIKTSRVEQ